MGKKLRVFHVARELNISNEAVIKFLGKKDKTIRNQMSSVSQELYEEICNEYSKEKPVSEAVSDFRQQIKEKHQLDEMRRNKARLELEERLRFATKLAEDRPKLKKAREEERRKAEEEERIKQNLVAEKKRQDEKAAAAKEAKAAQEITTEEFSVVDMISKAKKEIDKEKKATEEKEAKKQKAHGKTDVEKAEKDVETAEQGKAKKPQKDKKAKDGQEADTKKEDVKPVKQLIKEAEAKQAKAKKKAKKKRKNKISEEEIQESIRQTLAGMEESKHKRRRKKSKDVDNDLGDEEKNILKVSEFVSVSELADLMDVPSGEVIKACLGLGLMVSINQRLDMDSIITVADEFGFDVEMIQEFDSDILEKYDDEPDDDSSLVSRPPVVTIMGHVDHGKTSLLDYIRKSSITTGEAGGITQHIGAYEVSVNDKSITFLDTPGHEAFTAMRARGAQVTDLVVLIVAADDGVQPQTVEAINHTMSAGVPMVIAINKIDKPNANVELIKTQLSEKNILVEDWGGKYQCVEISAKTGVGVDKLLEMISLEAELLELKANPDRNSKGVVIESKLDKGKGAIATVLIQNGTLKVGDIFVAGQFSGRVRSMYDERGKRLKKAPPSKAVQVVGFNNVPQAGDTFMVMDTEKEVREVSTRRQQIKREQDFRRKHLVSLDQISQRIKYGEVRELNIILKADVDGSNEALSDALMKLSTDEVAVNVIHKGVGGISESDVLLASASSAVVIGFHVRPTVKARELAKKEEIDIRLYTIIYDAVEEVKASLEGLLEPEISEELTATIEVRDTFKVPKIGTIAGCYVVSGKVTRSDLVKVYREDKLIHETEISSLKRFKDDVREIASGFECGIGLKGYDDLKVGDILETYKEIETARKL